MPRSAAFPLLFLALCAFGSAARAEGLDRDTLLTEAPAVPDSGTVRLTGAANGQAPSAANNSTGGVSGSLMWAPISRVAGDVGMYVQGPNSGPTVRVRIQILKQSDVGLDLTIGARFKEFGFLSKANSVNPAGEFEYLLAAGKSIGAFDAILNTVIGFEAGGPGSDLEAKAFVGYRIFDNLRAGLDGRVQAEYKDENGYKKPNLANDVDIFAGPGISWLVLHDKLQLQALAGVAKPRGAQNASPGGLLAAAFDF